MIYVSFTVKNGTVLGFNASGHSGYAEQGNDIVCAAVSSAVLMAANTVTEIQHINADIAVNDDGFLSLNLSEKDAASAKAVLSGLMLHLNALADEYSEFIKVKISEV